jgi:secreted PhoX family phosphatase
MDRKIFKNQTFKSNGTRRQFLEFLGVGAGVLVISDQASSAGIWGASSNVRSLNDQTIRLPGSYPAFVPLGANTQDALVLADGFHYDVVCRYGDQIGNGIQFGFNNDFIAFQQTARDRARLFVNQESTHPYLVSGIGKKSVPNPDQLLRQKKSVGASLINIKKQNGRWKLDAVNANNNRLDANTVIPFAWHEPIYDATVAIGTLANCSGGQTPWGTFLTCEENYDNFYGEVNFDENGVRTFDDGGAVYGWIKAGDSKPPEHYGWVVEYDPETKKSKKLVAMGRFAHEGATVTISKDGRCVVYLGDDEEDQCLYKFIANSRDSLETGELFVADTVNGKWISLDRNKNSKLAKRFKSQTDVLISTRTAALIVGGTPLHRPEDIAINPSNGDVLIALTNSKSKKDYWGSIAKLQEKDGDVLATDFEFSDFKIGGPESGFACPDNFTFDPIGNLWMTSDISENWIEKEVYKGFGNNSLFVIPMKGVDAGKVIRVASAPKEAEFTGPCFSDDGQTLFLAVQHPGSDSEPGKPYTSTWPDGAGNAPRPAIVAISWS